MKNVNRRKLLSLTSKTSAAVVTTAWTAPIVLSTAIPAHAQASPSPVNECANFTLENTITGSETDTNAIDFVNIAFPQFNPCQGTLVDVELIVSATQLKTFNYENPTAGPLTFDITAVSETEVIGPLINGSLDLIGFVVSRSNTITVNTAASAQGTTELQASASETFSAGGNLMDDYVGTGNIDFQLNFSGNAVDEVNAIDSSGNTVPSSAFTLEVLRSIDYEVTLRYIIA